MQNHIEGVDIFRLAVGFLQHVQRQALFCQRVEYRPFPVGGVPCLQEHIERGVFVQDIAFAVIGEAFHDELAIFVENFHPLA